MEEMSCCGQVGNGMARNFQGDSLVAFVYCSNLMLNK